MKLFGALALVGGSLVASGCHTTNAVGICNAYMDENGYGSSRYSLVEADVRGSYVSCLIRDNQTFTQFRHCVDYYHNRVASTNC
jgi:hypothetical protein